jgi:hypothetical protein
VSNWIDETKLGFNGTPWYEITLTPTGGGADETVKSGGTFLLPCSYTVSSFTDRTGAPGVFNCLPPATGIYDLMASAAAYCTGDAVTFALDNTISGRTYQLYKDGNAVMDVLTGTGSAETFTGAFAGAGEYTARMEAEGIYCAAQMNGVHAIVENTPPSVPANLVSNVMTICDGTATSATLTATTNVGSGAVYEWGTGSTVGDNSLGTTVGNTYAVSPSAPTTYWVRMKGAGACSAATTEGMTVSIAANPIPNVPIGPSSYSRCGSGTVTFSASVSSDCTIDWYTTSDGTILVSGGGSVTSISPSLTATTTYHAQARNTTTGCVSASRTAVTGTVGTIPDMPTSPSSHSRCGSGTVTFSAMVPADCTIDWYTALSSGSTVSDGYGATSFSRSISSRTTFYAQSRNTSTGCVSATRLAVVSTVNTVPTITRVTSSGAASQSVYQNTAINAIIYRTSNTATISLTVDSFLPSGVVGTPSGTPTGASYTITGAPSVTGTFGYTVTASMGGCTSTALSGIITSGVRPPGTLSTTLCAQCCYNGSSWVDCSVTTNAYPFGNASSFTAVEWSGNGTYYYSGTSDKNGRANAAVISSSTTTVNAVQLCKNLGSGWYLPAYEELLCITGGANPNYRPLNDLPGANLIPTEYSQYHWSSTEYNGNGGRYSSTNYMSSAVLSEGKGFLSYINKTALYSARCVWRP